VWVVAPRKISPQQGQEALSLWHSGDNGPETMALAVRYSLQVLRSVAPGASVEVRVPPYGAVQIIEGPAHSRGTPPAVIEMDPGVWLDLACGFVDFAAGVESGVVRASGVRSDLSAWLPIVSVT